MHSKNQRMAANLRNKRYPARLRVQKLVALSAWIEHYVAMIRIDFRMNKPHSTTQTKTTRASRSTL